MILDVDLTSEVPIYQQIRDRVLEAIAAAELSDGDALPSTRQLAVDLGINFHTVNKAYDQLRREGFLLITRKSGAVVQRAQTTPGDWPARLKTLLAEAIAHGMTEPEVLGHCERTLRTFEEVRA
ncbi:GntR family transcriptional regulator [Amycolatopsis sp. NPDC004368]